MTKEMSFLYSHNRRTEKNKVRIIMKKLDPNGTEQNRGRKQDFKDFRMRSRNS